MVASGPNSHSDVLGFGVLERKNNVILVLRLDYQPWIHVVVNFVGGGRILVICIRISSRSLCDLIACYSGDSGHGAQLNLSGLTCVKVDTFRILCKDTR